MELTKQDIIAASALILEVSPENIVLKLKQLQNPSWDLEPVHNHLYFMLKFTFIADQAEYSENSYTFSLKAKKQFKFIQPNYLSTGQVIDEVTKIHDVCMFFDSYASSFHSNYMNFAMSYWEITVK